MFDGLYSQESNQSRIYGEEYTGQKPAHDDIKGKRGGVKDI
jgi:hypothetical protein